MEFSFSKKVKPLKPSAIREIFKSLTDPSVISFAAGNPSPESFPVEAMEKFAVDIFEHQSTLALQYSITEGYPPLRKAVFERTKRRFNIGEDYDTCLITTGGQQGIELTCKVLCNEGDTVICENPSFIGALNAFRSYGCNTVGVEMDEDGINIEKLEEAIKTSHSPKLLYLIPTFQNPSGRTMSLEKRRACLALAKKYDLVLLEDNPYGELRFSGEEIPTIKSMDTEGRVCYCSSFSKILSAGMRIGFVICHEELANKIAVCKQVSDVHTNIFFQLICYKFLTEYDLDAHIKKIRALYRDKCGLMLSELDKNLPESIKYTRPQGGLFIWATLPDSIDQNAFVKTLVSKKLAVVPGATFNCDTTAPSQSFRMNYSTPSNEQIAQGVGILSETARMMLSKR